jgi:murein DD-endopeptidase MepM/ murein hydrolase activator NlpD
MTALFGGLFGLATVTTIIALLIQGVPPRDDRSLEAQVPSAPAAAPVLEVPKTRDAPKKRARVKIPGPWRVGALSTDPSARLVEGTVGAKSFIEALSDKGVPKDQVYRILKAFDGVRKFDKKQKNDRFVVALDRQTNRVRAFEYEVSPFEIFQAREEDGLLTASQLDMKIAEEEVSGSFYVGKDLARSIEWGGFEPGLVKVLDDALAGRMSTEGFEEGGVVRVVAVEVTALGEFAKYDRVVALEYRAPDPAAAPVRVYTFEGKTARGYFDDRGRQPDGTGWTSPVPGAPITSRYNPRRMHPVLKKVMPHTGTDFGAPSGTPVYAVYRGKVSHLGPAGPCGNMVAIVHPNGIESGYCHLSKFATGLKNGQKIGTRQLIGYVGTTGRSTGPHLHFWTRKDGKFFDAETLKMDGFRVIPVDERPPFSLRKTELDARLDAIPLPEPPPEPTAVAPATEPAGDADDEVKASPRPAEIDPGDGDDLVGPDLSSVKGPTP